MDRKANLLALAIVAGLAAPVLAQDSISKNSDAGNGMPGDALNWTDPLAQRTRYSVDSQRLTTSWGVKFGIVPLVKTDRPVNPALGQGTVFFNNLAGSFGMSRTERSVPFRGSSYAFWQAATAGINPTENDQSLNNPPLTPTGNSFQFTAFVNQFGTASTPASQTTVNSAIGAVVNFAPNNIRRFYVERSLLAVSNPTGGTTANNGSTSEGASDSNGQFYLRADANGANNPTVASRVQNQNIFRVNLLSRSSSLNVLGGAAGLTTASDAGSTQFVANNYTTNTLTIPSALPASLGLGGNGRYMGPDFARNYVYEQTPGSITVEGPGSANSYLAVVAPNVSPYPDHRGSICVYPGALFSGGSVATGAILARNGAGGSNNDRIALWGINSNGSVDTAKSYSIVVPASVTLTRAPASDNSPVGPTIFQTTAGIPATMQGYFGGHQGATAFQGGNSQVAIGKDLAGRGLIAGLYYESSTIGGSDLTPTPNNAIVVGRFSPSNPGGIVWQTVAWTYAAGPFVADCDGTPINGDWGLNGHSASALASPGQFDGTVDLNSGSGTYDRPIGRLQPALQFPGGGADPTVFGSPSFSMPAIDSVGNIWFTVRVAAINTYSSTTSSTFSRYDSALIRAIYNPDTFSYKLELVTEFGDRFLGKNSCTKYSLGGFVFAAANNATSPSTFFSSSVAPFADRNMNIASALTAGDMTTWGSNGAVIDPRTLGGLVLGGNVLYDVNNDNVYHDPSGASPSDPASPDESYSALMYINFRSCDCDLNGDTLVDDSDFVIFANAYNNLLDTFGDFNFDNLTDDSDFVIFAQAYDQLLCTMQPN